MGIFSSLKQWNDECNERGKVIEQQEAEKRRQKKKSVIILKKETLVQSIFPI
ncbi:hypothetical protein HMPREF9081_0445 [Centipeda periodontii DSM 2778]|uniref:Uncharacterized protein n=1 Tax=Centipeda periodontii DSM 2778 TaxID=888060 RepID=F5RJL0_9FIRM|nr:hypothetical protein HMPREF9081_0445 [Centipeda periodontii DSM 2778]